eukprot:PhM_4_TR3438/c0_g1_i1/m.86141/K01099/INPP5B_F; inositol polyphosphate 5-phosphatase INPP5B/F
MDTQKRIPPYFTDSDDVALPKEPNAWVRHQIEFYSDSYTRTERITVAVASFNVDSKRPSGDLTKWLRLDDTPAIIAVGLQELDMSANAMLRGETEAQHPWRETLCQLIGADTDSRSISQSYFMLGAKQMVGLYLAVFLHKANFLVCRHVRMNVVSTGAMMGALGNKGGIGLRLQIHRTSMLFVVAHLAAHMNEVDKRNKDFTAITSGLAFLRDESGGVYTTSDHDYVFFFGDLNYRIDGYSYEQVLEFIRVKNNKALLASDQLRRELQRPNCVFNGFTEVPPTFPPTYRFDSGTTTYDTSEKRRVPAFTDRILWWVRPHRGVAQDALQERVEQTNFDSFPSVTISDHKPISALFRVAVSVEVEAERRKIYEELKAQVEGVGFDRIVVPKIELSTTQLAFDDATYGSSEERTIVVENKGQCVVELSVHILKAEIGKTQTLVSSYTGHGGVGGNAPAGGTPGVRAVHNDRWLSVKPLEQVIFPGERATLTVECGIDRASLDYQELVGPYEGVEKFLLREWLVLIPKNGPPNYIEANVRVAPSCFGNTLEHLVRFGPNTTCVEAYRKGITETPSAARPRIPKEVWLLVDYLYHHGITTPDLFQTTGRTEDVERVRELLDTKNTTSIPVGYVSDAHAVATAFVAFLRDLQQPVIPYCSYNTLAISTTSRQYLSVLAELRSVHYNTLVYIISFLRYCLRPENAAQNGLNAEIVAAGFAHLLVQRPPEGSMHHRVYSIDELRLYTLNIVTFVNWCLTTDSLEH